MREKREGRLEFFDRTSVLHNVSYCVDYIDFWPGYAISMWLYLTDPLYPEIDGCKRHLADICVSEGRCRVRLVLRGNASSVRLVHECNTLSVCIQMHNSLDSSSWITILFSIMDQMANGTRYTKKKIVEKLVQTLQLHTLLGIQSY